MGSPVREFDSARLIALDPATHITGYALFYQKGERKGERMAFRLYRYGNIRAKPIKKNESMGDLQDVNFRCLDIVSRLKNFIMSAQPTDLVMEFPEFQGGMRGINASRAGDTLKLSFLCGKIALGWEYYITNIKASTKGRVELPLPVLVTPKTWKGQLPKRVSDKRCYDTYGIRAEKTGDDNFIDAIMIGHWFLTSHRHVILDVKPGPRRKDL